MRAFGSGSGTPLGGGVRGDPGAGAHSGQRDQSDRSIVIAEIGAS